MHEKEGIQIAEEKGNEHDERGLNGYDGRYRCRYYGQKHDEKQEAQVQENGR